MAGVDAWVEEVRAGPDILAAMNSLEYGSISFGDLGERFPEVLSGMTARRAGVDYGRLASAYLNVLKGLRKLASLIKTSSMESAIAMRRLKLDHLF